MQNKRKQWNLGKILQKIAPRIGATVILEPNWKIVGCIVVIVVVVGRRTRFALLYTRTMPVNDLITGSTGLISPTCA